jgi:hypothetical protein
MAPKNYRFLLAERSSVALLSDFRHTLRQLRHSFAFAFTAVPIQEIRP